MVAVGQGRVMDGLRRPPPLQPGGQLPDRAGALAAGVTRGFLIASGLAPAALATL